MTSTYEGPGGSVDTTSDLLRRHLVATGLAGSVATRPSSTIANCARLAAGEPGYTFGLSDWRDATLRECLDAVRSLCGGDPATADPDGPGTIEPAATLAGVARHRAVLADVQRTGGARVLLATGHPTGLLGHYAALGRALQSGGSVLVTALEDRPLLDGRDGRPRSMRFVEGVGCVSDGGSLRHTHLSVYMESMLDAIDGAVDLVIADHGMAGAAVEAGIPTLSIADVNDPALPLAQVRGRTDGVLVIDDNLAPRHMVPVTAAMLDWREPA